MTKQALKDKIKDLKQDFCLLEQRQEIKEEKARLDGQRENIEITKHLARAEANVEQLQKRIDEHPYKQLTDLLKAIAVKLPELNIKELAIHTKSKK